MSTWGGGGAARFLDSKQHRLMQIAKPMATMIVQKVSSTSRISSAGISDDCSVTKQKSANQRETVMFKSPKEHRQQKKNLIGVFLS